jgi:hypothetical protein
MAAVGADDEIGMDDELAARGLRAHAGDPSAGVGDEIGDLGFHVEPEGSVAPGVLGDEIEKIPLRHHGDEPAMRREMGEIGNPHDGIADLDLYLPQLLVRAPQEFLQYSQLVHQFERRGVDRIAAEIAQEIAMLFEHDDGDAGPRQ